MVPTLNKFASQTGRRETIRPAPFPSIDHDLSMLEWGIMRTGMKEVSLRYRGIAHKLQELNQHVQQEPANPEGKPEQNVSLR